MSIRDQIRESRDSQGRVVTIPEWDVTVEVRSMSARQRAAMQTYVGDDDQTLGDRQEALWAFLLTSCVYDPETGEQVFSHDDMDWLLGEKSFSVIDRLTTICLQESAVLKESVDTAGKSFSGSQTSEE